MPRYTLTSILFISLLFIGAGCSSATQREQSKPEQKTQEEKTTPQPAAPEVNKPAPKKDETKASVQIETTTPSAAVKEFSITAKNWEFIPSTITVKKGDKVRLVIKSVDVDHGFALTAFGINKPLKPGETATVEFTADKVGSHSFFCSVFCGSGHRDMKGTLVVTE